jgi:hypothetical protein
MSGSVRSCPAVDERFWPMPGHGHSPVGKNSLTCCADASEGRSTPTSRPADVSSTGGCETNLSTAGLASGFEATLS